MITQLLTTKLYIPLVRSDPSTGLRTRLVPRPRLIERLNAGIHCKLTLVSAPAGFGKTTLLCEWIHSARNEATPPPPVAWISLDKGDNDPTRFWTYFIAALQTIPSLSEIGIGEAALAALRSPGTARVTPAANANTRFPIESLLTGLINEIARASVPFVLILDDFHAITDQRINEGVVFLLDHMPPQMHLILSSRVDPPWPFARLRARGEMTELRINDLRFTPEEAVAFLNDVMKLDLASEDLAALEARTEGWIAGLQMAVLSMQGQTDVSGFIKAFTGSNRFILDYLLEEVLDQQSPTIQEFLMQTSILERMTASLCNAVTGNNDGQTILARLEQANLFLIPLDDERRWYRYHHLFADLLRSRLEQTRPEQVSALHLRASEWYEENELLGDAVSHALAADDVGRVAHLVEGNALTMLEHGELTTLVRWLDALPEEVVRSRPWLCVSYAWVLVHTGQLDTVESRLEDAEKALTAPDEGERARVDVLNPVEEQRVAGHITAIRAYAAGFWGDGDRAVELARETLERLPEGDLVARGYITSLLGTVLRWGGDLATAAQTTAEAIAISQAAGDIHVAIDALSDLALSQTFQGRLHEAAATCRDALQLANEYVRKGGRQPPIVGLAHARLSAVLRIWNDLEAAIRHAREGVALCEQWGQVDTLIACYVNLARALHANGDTDDALNVMQQARQIAGNLSSLFVTYTETHEARMRLAQGDVAAATRWAAAWENRLDAADDGRNFQYEFNNLTLARVFIVQGERQPGGSLDKALQLLRRLLQATEAAGRMARVIEILVLQALVLQAKGEGDQALTALERALFFAEPEGYVRVFIDEGAPIGRLLRQAVARGIAVDYANELLAALEEEKDERQTTELPPSPLAEPLSERELEVLRLLTTSLSTPEIADELCIAASTVRSHVKRIYRKLNVHRRMDAVLQAKELRLL